MTSAEQRMGDTGDRFPGALWDVRVGSKIVGGYTSERFTGESYSDRNFNRLDIHPGPFVTGQVSILFRERAPRASSWSQLPPGAPEPAPA